MVHDRAERHPVRLVVTDSYEVWVIGWTRGQGVPLHDHGDAAGALAVVHGVLTERRTDVSGEHERDLHAGAVVPLPIGLVHEVVAPLAEPVTTVHVYSPPLTEMSFYEDGDDLPVRTDLIEDDPDRTREVPDQSDRTASAIAAHLELVRAGLDRVEPHELDDELARGALVVDIRPAADRAEDGDLPGAVVVERIHLEWRLDPSSPDRLPEADEGRRVVVVCNEGYASSLAASTLRELGVTDATDLVGGYRAWAALRR